MVSDGRRGSLRERLVAAVPGRGWLLLAACYLASCWATVVTRVEWGPDSRLYLAWAYRYLGHSPADAAARTKDFLYPMDGVGTSTQFWPADAAHAYFTGSDGAVVGARPLYPLLSAPFVALLGPRGMLVVPFVSYAFVVAGVAVLAHRLWGRHWGLLAGLLMILPVQVSRWAIMGQTEGLAIALTVACLLFLPLGRAGGRRDPLWFGLLLVASLCVRQFALALTAGVVLAWLVAAVRDRRWRNAWLAPAAVATGVTVLVLAVQSVVTRIWFEGGALDLSGRYQKLTCQALHHCGVASVPWGLRYIGRADYGYLRADLTLLATVALFLVAVVWRRRSELTALAVGAALATLALNLLVVWPSYYRYFAPVHPLILLAGLALIVDLARRSARTAGPPVGGWVLVGVVYAGAAFVTWRLHARTVGTVRVGLGFVLLAAVLVVLVRLVVGRFGAVAGVVAGLAMGLSAVVLSRGLGSWREAILLAAAAGVAALLTTAGSFGPRPLAGLAGLLAVGAAVAPEGVALAAGVVGWSLAASLASGKARDPWVRPAWVALVVGLLATVGRVLTGGFAWHPVGVDRLISGDFRILAPDRVLYLTVLLAAVAVVARWRNPASWALVGTAAVALAVHVGDRSAGFLPAYPLALLCVAGLLAPWLTRTTPGAAHIPHPATEPTGEALSGTPTTATPRS